jgi:hypothetical protein
MSTNKRVPLNNPIGNKIKELVKEEWILDPHSADHEVKTKNDTLKVRNVWSQRYWDRLVLFLDESDLRYILSFEQRGNWNYRLYEAAKNKLFDLAEQELLGD